MSIRDRIRELENRGVFFFISLALVIVAMLLVIAVMVVENAS